MELELSIPRTLTAAQTARFRFQRFLAQKCFRSLCGVDTYRFSLSTMMKCRSKGPKNTAWASLNEAYAMMYLARETSIPVPRVHDFFFFRGRKTKTATYLGYKAQYIKNAVELGHVWDECTPIEQDAILVQLKGYIDELRSLTPPLQGYVQAIQGGPAYDHRLGGDFGPFTDISDMHLMQGIPYLLETSKVDENHPEHRLAFEHTLRRGKEGSYRIVFSHGDFAPRNVLIDRKTHKVAAIVDWEFAGWMPEYWETTRAHDSNLIEQDWWRRFSDRVLPAYPEELAVEQVLLREFIRS